MCCISHFNSIKRNRSDAKILVKSIMSNRSPVNMYHCNRLSHNFWINLHLFHILCVPVMFVCVTDHRTFSVPFSLLHRLWFGLGLTLIERRFLQEERESAGALEGATEHGGSNFEFCPVTWQLGKELNPLSLGFLIWTRGSQYSPTGLCVI